MAKTHVIQSSFLSGVLDPRASARVDTSAYLQALLTGRNIEPHHLGGVRVRRGTTFLERLSNVLNFETPDSATAPEGGTAANGYDQDKTTYVTSTGTISTTDPFVLLRYDLGSAKTIRHADIVRLSVTAGSTDEFVLQYSNNDSTYVSIAAMLVDTDERSYRFVPLTGATPITARYWRIAKIGGTDLGTANAQVAEFNLWTETSTISNVKVFNFQLSTSKQYLVALTDRSGFIYQDGTLLPSAYFSHSILSADIPEVDAAVGAQTFIFAHEDHPLQFVVESSSGLGHSNFQYDELTLTNIPQFDFSDSDSPTPTSEIQVITFSGGASWNAGSLFQIELDGAKTASIAYAGDSTADEQTTTAANIARAVQKLFTVPGFTGVACARTNTLEYTVTFGGASAKPYAGLMNVTQLVSVAGGSGSAATTRSQVGVSRAEPVWSATRGYPRTVGFFQGRLYLGGTPSLPESLFGSTVNVIDDFEIIEGLPDEALFITFNGQQLNAIQGLYAGRNLQVFTAGAEFRFAKAQGNPIVPGDVPAEQTQYGSAKISPVAVDGATLFVHRTRKAVRDFRFNYEEESYDSLGISSLAPHLLNSIADIAAWTGSPTDEINLVFVVNGDGTMAVLNTRRESNVTAWVEWETTSDAVSSFKAVEALADDIYFAVQRNIAGTEYLFLEVADSDMRMDCAVETTWADFATGVISGTNLAHLIGHTVRITIDGVPVNSAEVMDSGSAGEITIEVPAYATASSVIRIGLDYNPTVTPMPAQTTLSTGSNLLRKKKISNVAVKVRNTLGLLLSVNNQAVQILPDRYYDIDSFDDIPTPFSGVHSREVSSNWDLAEEKLVTFTQVDPLPMEILGTDITLEAHE